MNLHSLFPQPVAFFSMDRDFSKDELDFLLGQEKRSNTGNTTSTDHYILKASEMVGLNQFVQKCIDEYFTNIHAPKHEVRMRITQSWCNYTNPGQFHHKHAHPNSFISGVLYIKADKDSDKIHFFRDGYQQIKVPASSFNVYNSESWWLSVATGQLVLFPSHLTHMVETVKGDDTRISLAFNTFPVGAVGDEMELTALALGD